MESWRLLFVQSSTCIWAGNAIGIYIRISGVPELNVTVL